MHQQPPQAPFLPNNSVKSAHRPAVSGTILIEFMGTPRDCAASSAVVSRFVFLDRRGDQQHGMCFNAEDAEALAEERNHLRGVLRRLLLPLSPEGTLHE